ncbi:MAG: tetratricopeptide repeat protein [Proteobacteria bacterium]|nr:tetratricopeptide repeat protein [Pseudomonadota bacterium]
MGLTVGTSRKILSPFCRRRAQDLVFEGLTIAAEGRPQDAANRFKASLKLNRTAEAYTYWAWMESTKGNYHVAIHLCREAIRLDPDFGNPYNDIGSYYVALKEVDEAILWFEKAKKARKYVPRHYPYMNCGRIYRYRQEYGRALREYLEAQRISPHDETIRAAILDLESKIH